VTVVADGGRRPLRPRGPCEAGGLSIGGEQSGHVILLDHANTGDGVADRPAPARARSPRPASRSAKLAAVMRRLPQVLVNVKGVDKSRVGTSPQISDAVGAAQTELGEDRPGAAAAFGH